MNERFLRTADEATNKCVFVNDQLKNVRGAEAANPNKVMRSVDRALSILRNFTVGQAEFGLVELARQAELDKATVHRILNALARNGLIEQDANTRKYRLGAEVLRLARVREASSPLVSIIRPELERLVEATNETAHATLANREAMITIAVAEPQRATRVFVDPSQYLPFHASASGIAYAAFARPEISSGILKADKMKAFTESTPSSRKALEAKLTETRTKGYAIAANTFEPEATGVAAPYFGSDGYAVGCIAVAGISSRMKGEILAMAGKLAREAAEQVTILTGGIMPRC